MVEDNADAATALSGFLTLKGYECLVCTGGPSALEGGDSFRSFELLLDVGLPHLSGLEVARMIRARPDGTEFVLVGYSGYGREDDRHRALEAGMDAYFVKPADINRMLAKIEELAATKGRAGP